MVRVVCPNFQRPRSRHSSGESPYIVESDFAGKAAEALRALSTTEARRFDSDTETSSDACWDSDGGTCWENGTSDSGAEPVKKEELIQKRKARRRERNKVSAQAYRQRRKEQTLSQQKILATLEDHKRELLEQIQKLETEKQQVETFLRSCFKHQDAPYRLIPAQTTPAKETIVHHYHHHHDNMRHCSNIPEIMSVS